MKRNSRVDDNTATTSELNNKDSGKLPDINNRNINDSSNYE